MTDLQLKTFLDECFKSFGQQVDMTDYQTMTKTLLMWVEQLNCPQVIQDTLDKTK